MRREQNSSVQGEYSICSITEARSFKFQKEIQILFATLTCCALSKLKTVESKTTLQKFVAIFTKASSDLQDALKYVFFYT